MTWRGWASRWPMRLIGSAPAPADLSGTAQALAAEIAQALKSAKRPLVISGPSLGSAAMIQAAANVAWALPGAAPRVHCAGIEQHRSGIDGRAVRSMALATGRSADTLIILENDLYRRAPVDVSKSFSARLRHVVVLDSPRESRRPRRPSLLLPAATFAEADGTLVNSEGRAQRFFQAFRTGGAYSGKLAMAADHGQASMKCIAAPGELPHPAAVGCRSCQGSAACCLSYRRRKDSARAASLQRAHSDARQHHASTSRSRQTIPIPRCLSRWREHPDQPPPALIPFFWSPGWNSIQAVNKYQSEIGGPVARRRSGVRLIEPAPGKRAIFYRDIPAPFRPGADEWLLVPLYHIFGSEELSRLCARRRRTVAAALSSL